ncbi:hypothetical protein CYJ70_06560 [Gardnerella pickettii]|uniref:Uncharacterized protein n=1 Tax=Gardnerella pickettii TaxID=2914924 RepID=A0ABX4SFR8_9BIFI|nr:hypothetical protein CYJ70_06560 [Gardnerella pickettii]
MSPRLIPHFVPNLTQNTYKKRNRRSCRSRGLAALTSSLALKAHSSFNFEQAQRAKLPSRALWNEKPIFLLLLIYKIL